MFKIKNIFKSQKGSTLVGSLFIIVSLTFFASSALYVTNEENSATVNEMQTTQAFQVGSAGLEYASKQLDLGLDPSVSNQEFGYGNFTITTDPTSGTVTVTSEVGNAKKIQSIEPDFSNDCVNFDTTITPYTSGKEIHNVNVIKSCNDVIYITSIEFEWDWDDSSDSDDDDYASSNDDDNSSDESEESEESDDDEDNENDDDSDDNNNDDDSDNASDDSDNSSDEDAQVTFIGIEGTTVYNPGSVGSPSGGASSGETIDTEDYALTDNGTYEFTGPPHGIRFDQNHPGDGTYTITINFADGSQISTTFTDGVASEEDVGFAENDGVLTVDENKCVTVEVIGSTLTYGEGGSTIPIYLQLGKINGDDTTYQDLFDGEATSAGDIFQETTLDQTQYILKAFSYYGCFYAEYESTDSNNVILLKDGEAFSEEELEDSFDDYIDDEGNVTLEDNQVIAFFELGTSNPESSAYDLQDLVVLYTIDSSACSTDSSNSDDDESEESEESDNNDEDEDDSDGHSNNGHGNNCDGVDSSNPGNGNGGPNGEEDASGDEDDECSNDNDDDESEESEGDDDDDEDEEEDNDEEDDDEDNDDEDDDSDNSSYYFWWYGSSSQKNL